MNDCTAYDTQAAPPSVGMIGGGHWIICYLETGRCFMKKDPSMKYMLKKRANKKIILPR